jgi:hypothetical protein
MGPGLNMPRRMLCKYAQVFNAPNYYCTLLLKPVSEEIDCEKCDCYKRLM